jgi:hypothetical protein
MEPAFAHSDYATVYFMSFLALFVFFLSAVVVPVLFRTLQRHRQKQIIEDRINERRLLMRAFLRLDFSGTHYIDMQTFRDFIQVLYNGKRVPDIQIRHMYMNMATPVKGINPAQFVTKLLTQLNTEVRPSVEDGADEFFFKGPDCL